MSTGAKIAALSAWIDGSYPADLAPELVLYRRVHKIAEEYGEVGQALGGYTGENPRKGVTHTRGDVMNELLDVAITALGAWEHMNNNRGNALLALDAKMNSILARAGLVPESHDLGTTNG